MPAIVCAIERRRPLDRFASSLPALITFNGNEHRRPLDRFVSSLPALIKLIHTSLGALHAAATAAPFQHAAGPGTGTGRVPTAQVLQLCTD